jgi:recombination associated protein RdgC
MFKTASFCRLGPDFALPPLTALEEALQAQRFVPCGPTQPESIGWVPPRGGESQVYAEGIGGQILLSLCVEKRVLPASAVRAAVEQKIERYKKETGLERVGAKQKRDFKDEAILDLLPRAFTKRGTTTVWIDEANHMLVVGTGAKAGADKVITALVELLSATPGVSPASIVFKPVQTEMSAAGAMSHWLATREAPHNFTVDRDCELKTPDDQKSVVRYTRHTLDIDEVPLHIQAGKVPTQLALTWLDRLSFVLTDTAQIKRLTLLDAALENVDKTASKEERFDADAAIITGELAGMIPDLLDALGGEKGEGQAPAEPLRAAA